MVGVSVGVLVTVGEWVMPGLGTIKIVVAVGPLGKGMVGVLVGTLAIENPLSARERDILPTRIRRKSRAIKKPTIT